MKLVFYLSLVTASLAFMLTESKIFQPWRQWLKAHSRFFGELFSCGFCLGHWIALFLVILFKPHLFPTWWLFDYFLVTLMIAWVAGFQWALMCALFNVAGK
ncbi:DUF1360 domain-containing protein [candidate division KSB1 bacterium]|nr:MAG: DUF1360 domain-containing protein [candidate division KSB1 bacterium]